MKEPQTLAEFLGVSDPKPGGQQRSAPSPLRRQTIKQFCKDVLETKEYREFLLQRISLGLLQPQIETLLYYYAHGKPVERLEVESNPIGRLEDLSTEQIESRALHLLQIARTLREAEEQRESQGESSGRAVH